MSLLQIEKALKAAGGRTRLISTKSIWCSGAELLFFQAFLKKKSVSHTKAEFCF